MEAVTLIIRGNVAGNDNVLITKEWNRPQMKSMCFLAISPPCESPIFTYHILSPCLPCNTHTKTESLSARGLRCRLAKILIGFPQEFLFTGGWLVEGCLVSSPPSIPKALSVYNWYEINKCSRNLTTPGKVAISKLAIGNWRLSSFHRSLGVISFNKNWYKEPCSVLALSWQDWVFQPVAMMCSSRPQLQLQDMAKQCQACLFVSTKAEFKTQTELYSWGSFTAAM